MECVTHRLTFRIAIEEEPICFTRSATQYWACLYSMQKFSGYWDIYVYTLYPQATAQVSVYVFSKIPPATNVRSGYGFAIFDAQGKPRFSSTLNNLAPTLSVQLQTPILTASPRYSGQAGWGQWVRNGDTYGYYITSASLWYQSLGITATTALNFTFSRSTRINFGRYVGEYYGRNKWDAMMDSYLLFYSPVPEYGGVALSWGLSTRVEVADDSGPTPTVSYVYNPQTGSLQDVQHVFGPQATQWDYVLGIDVTHYD
jgi:hypothetical protein